MNRDQVIEAIGPISHQQIRNIEDAGGARVFFTPDGVHLRPRKGAQLLEVEPEGAKSMMGLVGLPLGMAKALSPNTFSAALSELLNRQEKYGLVLKDGKVAAIVPYRKREPLGTERVLQNIERAMPVQDYNRVLTLPDHAVSIEAVGEQTEPVVRGDLVRAGVRVMFSPLGTIAPTVQSFALRLECTNGMTSNHVFREFHYGKGGGEGDDVWQWFRKSVRSSYSTLDKLVETWRKLIEERVPPEDRAMIIAALIKKMKVGGSVAEAIRARAIEQPPQNSWDVYNLLTFATSHIIEAPQQVIRGQLVAADFTSEESHARTCPLCHRNR